MMEVEMKRSQLPLWAVNLLILLLPGVALWCIWHFVWGMLHTVFSFPFFVLFPGLILSRLIFLFRSKRSGGAKAWRLILYLLLLLNVLFLGMFSFYQIHRSSSQDAWDKFISALPEKSKRRAALGTPELGTPEDMRWHEYETHGAVFESHAAILLCRCSPADYAARKAALERQYSFRTEPLIGSAGISGENALLVEPSARIGSDLFRFIFPDDDANAYGDRYFKSCLLLVTNDERCELGFIAFSDDELDEAEDLTKFLKEYCGWRIIRS